MNSAYKDKTSLILKSESCCYCEIVEYLYISLEQNGHIKY